MTFVTNWWNCLMKFDGRPNFLLLCTFFFCRGRRFDHFGFIKNLWKKYVERWWILFNKMVLQFCCSDYKNFLKVPNFDLTKHHPRWPVKSFSSHSCVVPWNLLNTFLISNTFIPRTVFNVLESYIVLTFIFVYLCMFLFMN